MTLPNILTLLRILATPAIVALAALATPTGAILAACLFAAAAITDWLDGYLARRLNQTSAFGAMFDPIADKLQVGATLAVLLWLGSLPGWHLLPAAAILGRELFVSGLREAMASMQAPRIPSSFAAKAKTTAQMAALALLLLGPAAGPTWLYELGLALLWVAGLLSLTTGFAYLKAALSSLATIPSD